MKYDDFLKVEKIRSKPRHLESKIQRQIVQWFRENYPMYLIAAIPNGGKRNALEAKIMKAEGVLAGFSDIIIIAKHRVMFVEIKTEKGRQSNYQKTFQANVERLGFSYEICRSLKQFVLAVDRWLKLQPPSAL